ncbi:uncharacterized protein LOC116265541 [Nymphaea colorata]|nr:uncharacterized protein LOC116265541 [Nymphaea colorata]
MVSELHMAASSPLTSNDHDTPSFNNAAFAAVEAHRAWMEETIIEINRRLQNMERSQVEAENRLHAAITAGFRDLLQKPAPHPSILVSVALGSPPSGDQSTSSRSPAHSAPVCSVRPAPSTWFRSCRPHRSAPCLFFHHHLADLALPLAPSARPYPPLVTPLLRPVGMNAGANPGWGSIGPDCPARFFPNSTGPYKSICTYGGTDSTRFKPAKIDFPRFNGEDRHSWTFKAEQFFECHGILETIKVAHGAMNFEGVAIRWYRWLVAQHGRADWRSLIVAMAQRFGPSAYIDYNIELSKIRQKGTLVEYQESFEELSNMVRGWPTDALIGTFVGVLKEEIRIEMQSMRPLNLHDCFAIARMVEEKHRRYQVLGRGPNMVHPQGVAATSSEVPPARANMGKPASHPIVRHLTP